MLEARQQGKEGRMNKMDKLDRKTKVFLTCTDPIGTFIIGVRQKRDTSDKKGEEIRIAPVKIL
jgi:hypothetical protein